MAAAGEPEVIRDKAAMRAWSRRRRAEGRTVVLVPTMGFLHRGGQAVQRRRVREKGLPAVATHLQNGK
jgi:pantothenate synthetase